MSAHTPGAGGSSQAPPPTAPVQYAPVGPLAYQPMDYQTARDLDHLRLLSLFHYIYGGIVIAVSCFALIYVAIGVAMILNPRAFAPPPGRPGGPPPEPIGWLFAVMGGATLLLGWTLGVLTILSGRWIKQRRRRIFCMVVAGINCMWVPLGTALGVFTFVVLLRESVLTMYQPRAAPLPPAAP